MNWRLDTLSAEGGGFALTQDDMVPYGNTIEMQSLGFLCSRDNPVSFRAVIFPIERIYRNTRDTVSVGITVSDQDGRLVQRIEQIWRNGNVATGDDPRDKSMFSDEAQANDLVKTLIGTEALRLARARFTFSGDERGVAIDEKNGLNALDIDLTDFKRAVERLRQSCAQLHSKSH